MPPLFLSRARLRRDAPIAALAPILLPADPDHRLATAHRLLWTLFSDGPDRNRDFLWREEQSGKSVRAGHFYVLSTRAPADPHRLFDLETKPFDPALAPGDRLSFILRANAVVTRKDADGHPRRHDVVMDRLSKVSSGSRGAERQIAIDESGRKWLEGQAGQWVPSRGKCRHRRIPCSGDRTIRPSAGPLLVIGLLWRIDDRRAALVPDGARSGLR